MHAFSIATLSKILAPQGILTVTTGAGDMATFLRLRYGTQDAEEIAGLWRADLDRIQDAKAVILGIPIDTAGFDKGQGKGPLGIRLRLLAAGVYNAFAASGVVDIGDCRNHPLLVHDELLNENTLATVRSARWGDGDEALPVAPLSILERALHEIWTINPFVKVLLLGGDHGLSWMPFRVIEAMQRNENKDLGILHFDAHTDLMAARDGVAISFATWAHHANQLIGARGRLQQVGIRISGKSKAHWESNHELRQFWADEVATRGAAAVATELVQNLRNAGVKRVWISNDIDGTDPRWAASTGTLEPNGLTPMDVHHIISEVGNAFDVIGGDVVEVAPVLRGHIQGEPLRTLDTATGYLLAQLDMCLGDSNFASQVPIPAPALDDTAWDAPLFSAPPLPRTPNG